MESHPMIHKKNPKFEFPRTAICCTNCSSMHTTSNGIATSDSATTTTLYLFFDCFFVSNHSLNYYTSNNSPIELYAFEYCFESHLAAATLSLLHLQHIFALISVHNVSADVVAVQINRLVILLASFE